VKHFRVHNPLSSQMHVQAANPSSDLSMCHLLSIFQEGEEKEGREREREREREGGREERRERREEKALKESV